MTSEVKLYDIFKDLDRRYSGVTRTLLVTGFITGSSEKTRAICEGYIEERPSKGPRITKILVSRLQDPGRFQKVAPV